MCMHPTSTRFSLVILLGVVLTASGQQASPHKQIEALVDHYSAEYAQASKAIWEYAELGYHEEKSSALLQRHLQEAGFRVEPGVAAGRSKSAVFDRSASTRQLNRKRTSSPTLNRVMPSCCSFRQMLS